MKDIKDLYDRIYYMTEYSLTTDNSQRMVLYGRWKLSINVALVLKFY